MSWCLHQQSQSRQRAADSPAECARGEGNASVRTTAGLLAIPIHSIYSVAELTFIDYNSAPDSPIGRARASSTVAAAATQPSSSAPSGAEPVERNVVVVRGGVATTSSAATAQHDI
eukprot:7528026-Pyramimonas_sp.AAC.1